MSPDKVNELVDLQLKLLEGLLPLLSPRGRLLYSTCTIHPDENRHQIENLLANHSELRLEFERQIWPNFDKAGDGFYAALIELV